MREARGFAVAEDEAGAIKKLLEKPPATVYRIGKHLGSGSGDFIADSVADMVEQVQATEDNPSGTAIWHKRNDAIHGQTGVSAEVGQYVVKARHQGAYVPDDLTAPGGA